MRDAIEKRIELHDKNHIEIKLDYAIDPSVKHNRYRVECFFFVPQSLGVNDLSYGRAQFYRASQAYIRFRTPLIALAALASPTNKSSPLMRMKASLEKLQEDGHDEKHAARISYELRLLACSIRSSLRDRTMTLIGQMAAARESKVAVARLEKPLRAVNERNGLVAIPSDAPSVIAFPNEDVVTRIELGMDVLMQELAPVIGQLRDFGVYLQDSVVPESLRRVFTNVDEYVSLSVEHYMTMFIEEMDKRQDDRLAGMRAHVRDILVAEQKRRSSMSYPTLATDDNLEHEHFVHRAGILKKFAMSCLFLTIRRREEGRAWADFAASLGAGVGMTASLVLTAVNEKTFAMNSLAFFTAAVLAYALRDRMKEWAKRYFGARVTRWVRDYLVDIVDPTTGTRIGRCRESFVFAKDVPPEIASMRENRVDNLLPKGPPEVVLKYDKQIELEAKLIDDLHGRLHDINDIIRFNVSSLMVRTDDPVQTVHAYDPASDSVKLVDCPKVYHVNLVFALRDEQTGRAAQLTRIRVIVDKGGIKRLEEVRAT